MKLIIQKTGAVLLLSAGLLMLAWAGHGFAKDEQQGAPNVTDEERGPRFCPPTAGEIAEDIGIWIAARKLALLGVAATGALIACGSFLSLVPNKNKTLDPPPTIHGS